MLLPTEVKVAGVTYTVKEQENLINIEEAWGRIDFFNSNIRVDKSLSDDRKEQSFIHEVTHAIFLEAGYKEQEEDMINRISIVLYQVLKDNPKLLNPFADFAQVTVDNPNESLTEDIKDKMLEALRS